MVHCVTKSLNQYGLIKAACIIIKELAKCSLKQHVTLQDMSTNQIFSVVWKACWQVQICRTAIRDHCKLLPCFVTICTLSCTVPSVFTPWSNRLWSGCSYMRKKAETVSEELSQWIQWVRSNKITLIKKHNILGCPADKCHIHPAGPEDEAPVTSSGYRSAHWCQCLEWSVQLLWWFAPQSWHLVKWNRSFHKIHIAQWDDSSKNISQRGKKGWERQRNHLPFL